MPRTALITGASGGIGLAIAHLLGEHGYSLTIAGRRQEKLERATGELRETGLEVRGTQVNLQDEAQIVSMFAGHRRAYGRLDVLVNNAGVFIGGRIEKADTRAIHELIGVNLRALVIGTREGLPMLRSAGAEHGEALIVNTASIAGKAGMAGLSVYAATKRGVISFTRSTCREIGGSGIRCTVLAPSLVDTPMIESAGLRLPRETLIRPDDVSEAVRFLLRISRKCHIPEIVFTRAPGGRGGTSQP